MQMRFEGRECLPSHPAAMSQRAVARCNELVEAHQVRLLYWRLCIERLDGGSCPIPNAHSEQRLRCQAASVALLDEIFNLDEWKSLLEDITKRYLVAELSAMRSHNFEL